MAWEKIVFKADSEMKWRYNGSKNKAGISFSFNLKCFKQFGIWYAELEQISNNSACGCDGIPIDVKSQQEGQPQEVIAYYAIQWASYIISNSYKLGNNEVAQPILLSNNLYQIEN